MQPTTGSSTLTCGRIMRVVLLISAVVIATVLLLWLHKEQSHVERCEFLMAQKVAAKTEPAAQPPINVVVHIEGLNQTKVNATQTPPSDMQWDYNWDHKAWKDPSEANGVATRTIVLVRHGQYDFSNGLLNDLGKQQANLTGMRLRELGMRYDRIIHSDMDRAIETAKIIRSHLGEVPIGQDPIIAEGGPTPPDPTVNYWSLPERTYFVESVRLEAAFRKYFYRADKHQTQSTDILVGHGNIFRFLMLRALQLPADAWMRVFIPHGSISVLHINPDGTVTMTKFGDSGHFPPKMITI